MVKSLMLPQFYNNSGIKKVNTDKKAQFLINALEECDHFSWLWLIFHSVSIRGIDNHACISKLMYPTSKMQF